MRLPTGYPFFEDAGIITFPRVTSDLREGKRKGERSTS